MSEYVKITAIQSKLKAMEDRIVYIYGAAGYGKTAAVEYFLRRKRHLTVKGCPGVCQDLPELEELKDDVVVVDDLQWVTDDESRDYIKRLCMRGGRRIILIGRSQLPHWLVDVDLKCNFFRCNEGDFVFGEKEIRTLFAQAGIALRPGEVEFLKRHTKGHPVGLKIFLRHMESGESLNEKVIESVRLEQYFYSDQAFWEKWDEDLKETLIAVCAYPSFTTELAGMLTLKKNVVQILEDAHNIGNFICKNGENAWEIRPFLKDFLLWKQSFLYSREDYLSNYREAARYFERQGQIDLALEYYEKAEDTHKISQMLLKNASRHAGVAHFFETRKFYLSLPKEEVLNSPVLMSGMCMLHSIMLQKEESEEWYQELVTYSKKKHLTDEERKSAKARLVYLDIALPHRGIHGIINMLKNAAFLLLNRGIKLPEFSVTSNIPSLMNGGLDFCEWSRIDKELAAVLKKPVEAVLGAYGKGLVNIALAESGFEKGTMSDYEVQTRLNTGSMMADAGGKMEMCFAASGILIKYHLFRGQMGVAKSTWDSIRRKAENEGAVQLFGNMEALRVWLCLLVGNREEAEKWLSVAPDEIEAFCILDRYRYMLKIRCLIALERYGEASGLIERMNLYFTEYERHYHWMENQVLKAVLFYRTGNGGWQEILAGALKKAEYYHFIRVVAQEGAAVKPLLDQWENESPESAEKRKQKNIVDPEFLAEVKEETDRMASFYPDYLKADLVPVDIFTQKELEILKLLCRGNSTEEICRKCGITYNSLKFHNKNIYKKLGVTNRQEAERKAALLEL